MDMNQPDRALGDQLSAAASSIDVDPTVEALAQVRDTFARRRRRRQFTLGAFASMALLAGGVVAVSIVNDDDPGQLSIEGAPSETTEAPDDVAEDSAAAESSDASSEPADTTPAAVPGTSANGTSVGVIDAAAADASAPGGDRDGYVEWLVPWRDGFLAGRSVYTPQVLPELPDEIVALFPPEVVEFFNGELPPTIEEATTMLSDAGLLDEVTAVLAEHPEASDAIYSVASVDPQFEVMFTTDGVDWEPVEFAAPEGLQWLQSVQTVGDRLVVMSQALPEFDLEIENGPFGPVGRSGAIAVASTTDLVNWDVVELPPLTAPAGLPDALTFNVYPQSLAANADGWVVSAGASTDVDFQALLPVLPADFADVLNGVVQNYGYGYGIEPGGIRVSIEGPWEGDVGLTSSVAVGDVPVSTEQPVPASTVVVGDAGVPLEPGQQVDHLVTWDELGVDAAQVEAFDRGDSQLWAASWGGDPIPVDAPPNIYSIVATSTGFYGSGETLAHSPDGIVWTDIELPVDGWVQAPMPLSTGGIAVIMQDPGEVESGIYRLSGPTAEWEHLDVPGLPAGGTNLIGGQSVPTSATIVDAAEQWSPDPVPIVVDVDGFTITMTSGYPESTITIVDSATGDVVLDEDVLIDGDDGSDPVREWTEDGLQLRDPAIGKVIVTVPQDVMNAAFEAQYNQYDEPPYHPDTWVLATLDGDRWLVDDLDDSGEGDFSGPGTLAINGTTLLMSTDQAWLTYDLS